MLFREPLMLAPFGVCSDNGVAFGEDGGGEFDFVEDHHFVFVHYIDNE